MRNGTRSSWRARSAKRDETRRPVLQHHGRSLGRTAAGLGHDIAGIMMAEHLETFIERTRSAERQLPRYVERELRAYLECGILALGFYAHVVRTAGKEREGTADSPLTHQYSDSAPKCSRWTKRVTASASFHF